MTAPGNSTVLVVLLAAFVACSAYAAGRQHQRLRTRRDRDEAYRDGYDTATRSVFSLAARIMGPRRSAAIRGSAKVPAPPTRLAGATSTGRRRSRLASYRDNARTLPRAAVRPVVSETDEDTTLLPPSHVLPSPLPPSPLLPRSDVSPVLLRPDVSPVLLRSDVSHVPPRSDLSDGETTRLAPSARPGRHTVSEEETTRLPPVPRPRSS